MNYFFVLLLGIKEVADSLRYIGAEWVPIHSDAGEATLYFKGVE